MLPDQTFDYIARLFSATFGDIVFTDADGEQILLETREADDIAALLNDDPSALMSLVTATGEVAALAALVDKGPIPATFTLYKASKTVCVWVLDRPAADGDRVARVKVLNSVLNGPDTFCDDPWPVAGIGGWAVGDETKTYTLEELEEAFKPALEVEDWALNDAVVRGGLDDDLLNREITIAVSPHGMKTGAGKWKNMKIKFGALLNTLTHHRSGEKDGHCILQGEVIDGERKINAIRQCSLLMLDLDTGENIDAIRAKVKELGWFSLIWTTYNHLKPLSEVRKDQVLRWMGRDEEPTLNDVVGYLKNERRYQSWVLKDAVLLDPAHTKEGVMLRVRHAPMPKFRLLFVLNEPFVFATRATNPRKAIEEWKARYAGVSELLGAAFDRSCVDPSRLMFTARHPGGADGWAIEVIPGTTLNIDTVPPVDPKRMKQVDSGDAFDRAAAEMLGVSGDIKTPWLKRWLAINAESFDAEGFWRDKGVERKPRSNGPGCHFKCPNDGNHSNPDDEDDNAFFVVSGPDNSEGKGFAARCMHDSCSGLDRGQMLDMFIQDHGLEERDLEPYIANAVEANPGREVAEGEDAEDYKTLEGYPPETRVVLKQMNRDYAFITMGSEVRILIEPRRLDDVAKFMRLDSWKAFLANRKVPVRTSDGETRMEYASKVWMEWPERRSFPSGVCFEPDKRREHEQYNLWRGYPIGKGKPGDWSLLRDHLFENICGGNEEYFEWAMTWFAHMFQRPGEKIGSAFVVRGKKGTGKSKLFEWVSKAMGRHAIKVSHSGHVVGNFNGHQKGIILMVCEEAFWAGSPAAGGVIKDLITSNTMMLEQKGIDAVQTSNYARLAFVSNEDWVVPAGVDDERRFFVLECGTKRQQDTIFFAAVEQQMEAGGVDAMVYEFMNWTPPGGNWDILRTPPKTEALREQAMETLDVWDYFFLRLLEEGGVDASSKPDIVGIELNEDEENLICAKTLRAHLLAETSGINGAKAKLSNTQFLPKLVRKWLGSTDDSIIRRGTDGMKNRHYRCGSLNEMRARVEREFGIKLQVGRLLDDA